jgi:hypothetical protein
VKKAFLMALLLATTARISAGEHPSTEPENFSLGVDGCERSTRDDRCRIVWIVSAPERAYYWIEGMDPESSVWRRMIGPVSSRSAVSEAPLVDGRLYRVVACDDDTGTRSCVSSKVLWAPLKTEVDAIPSIVEDKRGVKMFVSKKSSAFGQHQQYNMYMLMRLMSGVADMRSMPPMTPPRFGLDVPDETLFAEATQDEIIHQTVYSWYEARRTKGPE